MVAQNVRQRPYRERDSSVQAAEWVEEYPFASVATMFGIGVGVGLIIGHSVAEAAGRRMFHQNTLAEKLSSQIMDVLKNSLPQSLSRQFS